MFYKNKIILLCFTTNIFFCGELSLGFNNANYRNVDGCIEASCQIKYIYSTGLHVGYNHKITPVSKPGTYAFRIEDEEKWSWAIAVAPANAPYLIPGENDPIGFCPPGCPPLPKDFSGKRADIGKKK